jgi:phosphatidylglycerol:prolipoprotein diacylglycerol transferase
MHPEPLFLNVYPYGLMIAIGILCCFFVLFFYGKLKGVDSKMLDFTFYNGIASIALGFVAAAIWQADYNYIDNPAERFHMFSEGLTFIGGLIGGVVCFLLIYFIFRNKLNIRILDILSLAPCCITVAHAFGRIGCLMAGCCYGRVATSGFRIYNHGAYRVPVQLYEALFLFALFAVLSILYFKKWNINIQVYLIAYAIWRFIIEIFRSDARGAVVLGLQPSQWQSVAFIAGGVALFVIYILKKIPLKFPPDKIEDPKEEISE